MSHPTPPTDYTRVYRGERPSPGEIRLLVENPMVQTITYRGWDIAFSGWRQHFNSFVSHACWVATRVQSMGMWVSTTGGSLSWYASTADPWPVNHGVTEWGGIITPWSGDRRRQSELALKALLDKLDAEPTPGA